MCYACLLAFPLSQILRYKDNNVSKLDEALKDRLIWNGSQDLQEVSIVIINVTYNDSGLYECYVIRTFEFDSFTEPFSVNRNITLKVKEQGAANSFPLSSMLSRPVLCSGLATCLGAISVQLSVKSSCDSVLRYISLAGLFHRHT